MNKVSLLLDEVNKCLISEDQNETKFRGSIYVDLFIPDAFKDNKLDVEGMREEARKQLDEFADVIPNSYIGGVAMMSSNLLKPMDQEI